MHRCLQLATLGAGKVAPNPMVGALLLYENRIIGEGYHQQFGGPHAEVNCINSVAEADKKFIEAATMYVSLEPCAHFGKTPPCADLIIKNKIGTVVIGCRDCYDEVDGKGIEKLKAAGIHVVPGVLENECKQLNARFFTFHERKRPYIILKWAQSSNGMIAGTGKTSIKISNEFSDRLVHKWRSEEAAILVGTNTALADDPLLTTRLWSGRNPVRLVIDKDLKLPASLKLFDNSSGTIVFNNHKQAVAENLTFHQLNKDGDLVVEVLSALHGMQIQSVIVEGGTILLQSFIDEGLWDEARVITNATMIINEGVVSPVLKHEMLVSEENETGDIISYYRNDKAGIKRKI